MVQTDKYTLHVTWSPDIQERVALEEVDPANIFRKGTERGVYVACRNLEEADLLQATLNSRPGVHAQLWEPL